MRPFRQRSTEPELMDCADADAQKLLKTIAQFKIINLLFSSSRRLIRKYFLRPLLRNGIREFTMLDIGAGGCDIPVWLVQKCRKLGLTVRITCVDYDEKVLAYARSVCEACPEISIIRHDALAVNSLGKFDFVYANNFLHHLDEASISTVLKQTASMVRRGCIFNDIYRSRAAYWLYTLFAGLFLHGSFAFYDGRLSIRKGFRQEELEQCIHRAGLSGHLKVMRKALFRTGVWGFY